LSLFHLFLTFFSCLLRLFILLTSCLTSFFWSQARGPTGPWCFCYRVFFSFLVNLCFPFIALGFFFWSRSFILLRSNFGLFLFLFFYLRLLRNDCLIHLWVFRYYSICKGVFEIFWCTLWNLFLQIILNIFIDFSLRANINS